MVQKINKEQFLLLVVDDEPSVRQALCHWFSLRGFVVDHAVDGLDAVEKCQNTRYDVITMDLEMPRMNGIEAIKAIRMRQPDVPIVVFTGYQQDNTPIPSNTVSAVLTKPMRPSELEKHIRLALQGT